MHIQTTRSDAEMASVENMARDIERSTFRKSKMPSLERRQGAQCHPISHEPNTSKLGDMYSPEAWEFLKRACCVR